MINEAYFINLKCLPEAISGAVCFGFPIRVFYYSKSGPLC
jgi:hypothetical protein